MAVRLDLFSEKSGLSDFAATDDEMERLHLRQDTSLETKLWRIREGRTPTAMKKKQRLKDNKSILDFWKWYLQKPTDRLPFLYFTLVLLLVPTLSTFWWMDQDSAFIITGVIGLIMTIYAVHKFKTLIGLKKEIDAFKILNFKFRKDVKALTAECNRVMNAHSELRKTKRRITRANNKNKDNLHRFEHISSNMRIAGQKQISGMAEMHEISLGLKSSWRNELLAKERALLHSAYERFEKTGHRHDGVTYDQFKKLSKMLPKRYSKRFKRMGTFDTFALGGTVIDFKGFTNAIDLYATMEVDNVDLDPTPYVTPSHTPQITPRHTPMHSGRDSGLNYPKVGMLEFNFSRSHASDDHSYYEEPSVSQEDNDRHRLLTPSKDMTFFMPHYDKYSK